MYSSGQKFGTHMKYVLHVERMSTCFIIFMLVCICFIVDFFAKLCSSIAYLIENLFYELFMISFHFTLLYEE